MKAVRVAACLVAAATLAGGCGGGDEATETTPTVPVLDGTQRVPVYFLRGDRLGVAARRIPAPSDLFRNALEQLLDGPTPEETDAGLTTLIPSSTRLLGVEAKAGVATVNLSGAFDDGGGSASMLGRLAQVVFTLTWFPTVETVQLELDDEPVEVFSSEGIVLDGPQDRADYEDQSPAILVETPAVGEVVSSPLRLRGTANTFEATFEWELLDADGRKLAGTFGTATCGTGCRGKLDVAAPFDAGGAETGTLVVFARSAEDGSRIHEVEIPVRFEP